MFEQIAISGVQFIIKVFSNTVKYCQCKSNTDIDNINCAIIAWRFIICNFKKCTLYFLIFISVQKYYSYLWKSVLGSLLTLLNPTLILNVIYFSFPDIVWFFSSFPPRAGIDTLSKDLLRLDAGCICTYSLM